MTEDAEITMVQVEGIEPSRPFGHRILSPARLPVPPHLHLRANIFAASLEIEPRLPLPLILQPLQFLFHALSSHRNALHVQNQPVQVVNRTIAIPLLDGLIEVVTKSARHSAHL